MTVYNLGKRRRRVVRPSPLFLAFVAVTALGAVLSWTQSDPGSRLGDVGVFLFVLGGWVVTLCFHEFAHAYAAYRAGDQSVESAGYLSLNPFKYAHPLLSIILPLFFIIQGGIGLPGGAVYLHPHTFRTKAQLSMASAVGPLTNAVFAAILLGVASTYDGPANPRFWAALTYLGFLQITAALLNLLPIPGLDGWGIIEPYLDPATQAGAAKLKPWGFIALIVLLQINQLNAWFFDVVYRIYDWSGVPRLLLYFGQEFFRFWSKSPL